jgi:hypothetical protein
MLRQTLVCGAVLALAGVSASADDKKDAKDKPALTGVWALQGGELKLEFADKDVLKIFPHGDAEVIAVVCSYSVEKGVVKAKITELDGKAKDKAKDILPVGTEFSFKWAVKDGTATLDDVKGDKAEALRSHMEGKFEKK